MKSLIQRFYRDERGVAAIEYSLIVTLIAITIIPALTLAGVKLTSTFEFIANHMQ